MQSYRTSDWARFRAEVIRLDGGVCVECGQAASDDVILCVHHKTYITGRKPWEYPYELCETLCRGCHAAKHGIIPPKFGWEHIGWDDLGDLIGTCEYCGTGIRYVFLVQHAKWRTMEVGEMCCDNLTSTQAASNLMDSKRRFTERLKRFVSSRRWENFESGSIQIVQKKVRIEVVPFEGKFRLRVERQLGKKVFPSVLDAKIKAFELLESGELHQYISTHPKRQP